MNETLKTAGTDKGSVPIAAKYHLFIYIVTKTEWYS